MQSTSRRLLGAALAFTALSMIAVGCSKSDSDGSSSSSGSSTTSASGGKTLTVPGDYKTIQAAVDAAKTGDLVLISDGIYKEAVDVTTPNITIRGLDRNKVILDGGFKLENGIRVLDTNGVTVENMTARNYLSNGFYWTGSDYYRGSYLTAYRNGDYAIYGFDAYHGQLDHSMGAGSPDAGFYIGECYKCDAVIDTVISQDNGLGYSGTNSGGDLYIINSTFKNNRAGIVPNAGSYEGCYPGRRNTIVGNIVHDNNNNKADAIDNALLGQGNGILLAGSVDNDVERNLVYNHDRTGIAAVPFPEDDANDVPPPKSDWDKPCDPKKKVDPKNANPGLVLWNGTDNRIVGNVVSNSKLADLASATIPDESKGITIEGLNNCFSDNTFTTSSPTDIETLAPCKGTGSGDWTKGNFDLTVLIADKAPAPPKNTYRRSPIPALQPNMPNAATAPAPVFKGPKKPNVAAIQVPEKPAS